VDINVRAFRVVQAATEERAENDTAGSARRAAARKGGLIGGPSRARSISAQRRREIAREASKARWQKTARKAGH
jgi:hypothetical protein